MQNDIEELKDFPLEKLVFPYTIDKKIGKYCFEVNGPTHFNVDEKNNYFLDGITSLKKFFIEKLGLVYVNIPYYEF